MSNAALLALSLLVGASLGMLFFGGLWWTLRKGLLAKHAALLIVVSSQLRTAMVVTGFFFIGRHDWHRLAAAVAGFLMARIIISLWPAQRALLPISAPRDGRRR